MYKPDRSTHQAQSIGSGCGVVLPAEVVDAEAPDACGRVIRFELAVLGGNGFHERARPCTNLIAIHIKLIVLARVVELYYLLKASTQKHQTPVAGSYDLNWACWAAVVFMSRRVKRSCCSGSVVGLPVALSKRKMRCSSTSAAVLRPSPSSGLDASSRYTCTGTEEHIVHFLEVLIACVD